MGKQTGKGKRKQGKRKRKQIGGYVSSWFKKQRGKGTIRSGKKKKQKGGSHRGRHRSRR